MNLLRLFSTFIFFYWFRGANAVMNRTIDDTIGDTATGSKPLYLPSTPGVWEDATCKGCAVKPDSGQAFDGTWTAATYNPNLGSMSIELTFKGTAVYVFFILANFVADGITTETACNFTLNGREPVPFSHIPSQSHELQYNSLVFSEENLANDDHKLVISTSGIGDRDIFVNFDYAIYTFDDTSILSSTTPSSGAPTHTLNTNINSQTTSHHTEDTHGASHSKINVGLVAGCAIGGLVAVAAITLLLICIRCRRRPSRRQGADFVIDEELPRMAPALTQMHTPFTIDVASTEERFRERPQTHSDFLQSGTISSPPTARPLSDHLSDHDHVKASWVNAHPVSRARSVTIDASQLSTINSLPSGYTTANTSVTSSDTSVPLRHVRSSSAATNELRKETVRRTRQSEIDQQLRVARRDLRYLKTGIYMESVRRPPTPLDPPLQIDEGKIETMREQMRLMREQIERLQRQQRSERASPADEAPPGYSSPAEPYLTRLE